MIWLLVPLVVVLWLVGGQVNTAIRRFGVPVTATLGLVLQDITQKDRYKERGLQDLIVLLYIPIFFIGYGEHSRLMKWLKTEWKVRLMYALYCWAPLVGIAAAHGTWLACALACPALVGAFQVRAGKLATIGKFDILIEDLVRSATLGVCLVLVAR